MTVSHLPLPVENDKTKSAMMERTQYCQCRYITTQKLFTLLYTALQAITGSMRNHSLRYSAAVKYNLQTFTYM